MIEVKIPLRISLLGGGTDLAHYYRLGYGIVVNFTIDKFVRVRLIEKKEKEDTSNWQSISHDFFEKIKQFYDIKSNELDIFIKSDLGFGNGLGSSSAMCIGVFSALNIFKNGFNQSPYKLAEMSYDFEHNILNTNCGKQDQYAAAYTGMNCFIFKSDESVERIEIKLKSNEIDFINENILLIPSGLTHKSKAILSEQEKNISQKFEYYDNLRDLSLKFKDKILKDGFNYDVCNFIDEGWEIKKSFDKNIMNDLLERALESLKAKNWKGIKLLGAGGGGYFMTVLNNTQKEEYSRTSKKIDLPFRFYRNEQQANSTNN